MGRWFSTGSFRNTIEIWITPTRGIGIAFRKNNWFRLGITEMGIDLPCIEGHSKGTLLSTSRNKS